jgi:hypothetical protein
VTLGCDTSADSEPTRTPGHSVGGIWHGIALTVTVIVLIQLGKSAGP